ncbi:MAG: hypothetical protein M0R51_10615, partial [Clostridia bacterium]|nr:hypothetical protein [Clostridia bacterium]
VIYNGRNKDVITTNTIDNYEYTKLFPFSTGGRKYYNELQYAPKLKHKLVHSSEAMEIINLFN